MDFWEWLKGLVGAGQQDPDIQNIINSSFTQDTLFNLVNGPVPITQRPIAGENIAGFAGRYPTRISLDPAKPWYDMGITYNEAWRNILTHEVGHVADIRNSIPELDDISERYFDYAQQQSPTAYAAKNPTEYKAQIFMHSLRLLKEGESAAATTGNNEEGWRLMMERLPEYEKFIPGAGAGLFALLNHPFYKDHPLNQIRQQRTMNYSAGAVGGVAGASAAGGIFSQFRSNP